MKTVALTVALLLVANITMAEPRPWMKKENPTELFYTFKELNCPPGDYESIIKGAFSRSGLKSVLRSLDELQLRISLQCLDVGEEGFAYRHDIRFGYYSGLGEFLVFDNHVSSFMGAISTGEGAIEFLQNSMQASIESVIADYLKANFDL